LPHVGVAYVYVHMEPRSDLQITDAKLMSVLEELFNVGNSYFIT
jgi:hypothetical protein